MTRDASVTKRQKAGMDQYLRRSNTEMIVTMSDGVDLYTRISGRGPVVLIVQGGISDAEATTALAGHLADRHTVVSYDRRGLARSPVAMPTTRPTDVLRRHALDAATVLDTIADSPAHVVGASIGAVIALQLALERPELLATVVAHEPPLPALVPDAEHLSALDRVGELGRSDVHGAIRQLSGLVSDTSTPEPDTESSEPAGDIGANLSWFFAYDFPAVLANPFDIALACSIGATITPSVGRDARGGWDRRCGEALAVALGRAPCELPGGHNALTTHPRGAAERIRTVLDT
jgi:pimeloyl-ACP methyl ester carboxylesterase